MWDTAVIQPVGYLCQVEFVVEQQFFYPFDFMDDDKLLDGDAFDFRKNIWKVSVIVAKFLTDKNRVIDPWHFFIVMDHFDDHIFDLIDEDTSLIIQKLEPYQLQVGFKVIMLLFCDGIFCFNQAKVYAQKRDA